MTRARDVAISLLGYAEARSGLARGRQAGRLTAHSYAEALGEFEERWSATVVLDISEPLVRSAGNLAERHLLRGFDAIHLASALSLQLESGEPITFSAWDDRLLAAAAAEGLTPAPTA